MKSPVYRGTEKQKLAIYNNIITYVIRSNMKSMRQYSMTNFDFDKERAPSRSSKTTKAHLCNTYFMV